MVNSNIKIEGARIAFRNFSGEEGRFNPKGRRNFCVFLDDETALRLLQDGWAVKYLTPRDDDEERQAYLQVAVKFDNVKPIAVLITSKGKTSLNEDEIGMLDWVEIRNVDLIIRPYNWEVNGKVGVKAYLKSIYVTIEEDDLAIKYVDVPDSALNGMIKPM